MPSNAIPSTVESTALVPYLPARRASPDDMRSRSASRFIAAAATSITRPITRFPPIQPRSDVMPAPLAITITKERSEDPTPPKPSAASSEGSPGRALPPIRLTPAHGLDAGLGQEQERADDHREVDEVARVDEALEQLLEVLA